ncbi:unnamed protein product [Adineta steineri]|uniref:Uncharacterized protein n=1 Tax=Adineta steineri TaxID=433720 RepID=A0A813RTW1_9BILA|nr:unnamed protein product [Adineta steineri]
MNENSKIIPKADLTTHLLDLEQQIYYKDTTEETIPNQSSTTDLHEILSWIIVFIYEDVKKYISSVYRASRSTLDDLGHSKEEFGNYYGQCLNTQVTQLHQQSRSTTKSIQVKSTEEFHLSSAVNVNDNTYNHLETSQRSLSTNTFDQLVNSTISTDMNQYPIHKDSYPPSIESIRIVNKYLPASPPPSRKIIIAQQVPLSQKPQPIIIEKWLSYRESPKRRIIIESTPSLISRSPQKEYCYYI